MIPRPRKVSNEVCMYSLHMCTHIGLLCVTSVTLYNVTSSSMILLDKRDTCSDIIRTLAVIYVKKVFFCNNRVIFFIIGVFPVEIKDIINILHLDNQKFSVRYNITRGNLRRYIKLYQVDIYSKLRV